MERVSGSQEVSGESFRELGSQWREFQGARESVERVSGS